MAQVFECLYGTSVNLVVHSVHYWHSLSLVLDGMELYSSDFILIVVFGRSHKILCGALHAGCF